MLFFERVNKPKIIHVINNNSACGGAQLLIYDLLTSDNLVSAYYLHNPKEGPIINHPRLKKLTFRYLVKEILEHHSSRSILHFHLSYAFYLSILFRPLNLYYTEHNTTNKRRRIPLLSSIDRLIYSRFTRIFCISNGVYVSLVNYLRSTEGCVRVYNTISQRFILPEQEIHELLDLRLDSISRPVIAMTAHFSSQKNPILLVNLLRHLPQWKLILVGDGPELDKVFEHAASLGLPPGSLELTGALPQSSVLDILKQSHFYIQSSFWEGFGLAALESMSLALPTFLTDVPGLNELHCISLLSFKSEISPATLASRLNYLANNTDAYKEYSIACYNASLDFTAKSLYASYLDSYVTCQ